MISSQLPILGYNDLSALIMGTNHRHPDSSMVQALATSPNVIVAPAAIARFIALSCPELIKKDTLRLLIVGAGMVDTIDEGRWFHFIPLLCGAGFQIETTLVGPDCQRPPMKSPGAHC